MQQIKDDLQAIRADVSDIKRDIAVNTVSLAAHMSRTEINERRLEKLEYVLIGIAAIGVLGGVIRFLLT